MTEVAEDVRERVDPPSEREFGLFSNSDVSVAAAVMSSGSFEFPCDRLPLL